MELDVRRLEVRVGAEEPAGLGEVRGQRATPLGLDQAEVLLGLGGEQRRLVGRVGDPRRQVVLEPLADGKLVHARDVRELEIGRRADPREQEDLRARVGAGAEDHLALGEDLAELVALIDFNADRPHAVEQELGHVGVHLDDEIWALEYRVQVRNRRRAAQAVSLRHLIPADAVLLGAVEVLVRR